MDNPIRLAKDLGVMGCNDNRTVVSSGSINQFCKDPLAATGVKGSGWFVREHNRRCSHGRSRHRNALHLSPRECSGQLVNTIIKTEPIKQLTCSVTSILTGHPLKAQR